MDDERVWRFEEDLWTADAAHYRATIDDACVMVLPAAPYVMSGEQSVEAVANTPRWARVAFSEQQVVRPEHGLIVIGYHVRAERDGQAPYEAYCTSTYRRLDPQQWRVVQHQQTLAPKASASGERAE